MPIIARFGFSYQRKTNTSNAMLKWKYLQKTKTSNQRHLPVSVLSQKQERATKSCKKHRTAHGNMPQKPKRATKNYKEHFSFPFSFICFNSGPVEGSWHQERRRATKSSKKQRRATKSKNRHRSWEKQNEQ